jgi:hypothetical protein
MCTELILAIIYFSIIFLVNFFLLKLLLNYIKNIFSLLKIKTIFKLSTQKNLLFFRFLFFYLKKEGKIPFSLLEFKKISSQKDLLLISNLCSFFATFSNQIKNEKYYFSLLEKQFIVKIF